MKQSILFSHPGLSVHKPVKAEDRYVENRKAVLITRHFEISLDAAATEMLVGYLQVMRAYMANSKITRQQNIMIFEKVGSQLQQQLKSNGRSIVESKDINQLILSMGCLHDWASKKTDLLQEINTRT